MEEVHPLWRPGSRDHTDSKRLPALLQPKETRSAFVFMCRSDYGKRMKTTLSLKATSSVASTIEWLCVDVCSAARSHVCEESATGLGKACRVPL
eukprot:3182254-Amphidinium_carterae.1